jgi:hypothetical protein
MLKYEDPPTVLVVHIGGNDIRLEKTKDLCDQLKRLLTFAYIDHWTYRIFNEYNVW